MGSEPQRTAAVEGVDYPKAYATKASDREPLIAFMIDALEAAGCRILHRPSPAQAPFRITFVTPNGGRMGIVAYAFRATETPTKNRPDDEHSFQVKYGSKDGQLQPIWQDPYGLYTTLFLGINPEQRFFVGADPVLHNPTRFFIRIEFKQWQVDQIQSKGWLAWERKTRRERDPVEVLVGGRPESFLRYVLFEREAVGEDQGHRQLLAERTDRLVARLDPSVATSPPRARLHQLADEFQMSEADVLDLIAEAGRLKMAVRGFVAEKHLVSFLASVPGVSDCHRIDQQGGDVQLSFEGSRPLTIECKNVLRDRTKEGLARMDFQRTRRGADKCSRFYSVDDFDVVAACLHAVSEKWEFRFAPTTQLDRFRGECEGKLSNLVKLDDRWNRPVQEVLRIVATAR